MKRHLSCRVAALAVVAVAAAASASAFASALPGSAPATRWADRAYEHAVQLLNSGRQADAYGRLVALANAGHADSARLAMTLCRHGLRLYGSDWDCATFEMEDWARFAGQPPPGPLPPPQRKGALR